MTRATITANTIRGRSSPALCAAFSVIATILFCGFTPSQAMGADDDHAVEIAAATKIIESEDSKPDQIAQALRNRAGFFGQTGQGGKAFADLNSAIELKRVSKDSLARSLSDRAGLYAAKPDYDKAIADYTWAIELAPDWLDEALCSRADFYSGDKIDKAMADYDRILVTIPNISSRSMSTATKGRGDCYGRLLQFDKALAEYTKVIESPKVGSAFRAWALAARGDASQNDSDYNAAIGDYTVALVLQGNSGSDIAYSLTQRAAAFYARGDLDKSIADETRVIEMKDANSDQLPWALIGRANAYPDTHDFDKAVADLDKVVEMKNIGPDVATAALDGRGNCFYRMGQFDKAIADYTRAGGIKDGPPTSIDAAFACRGVCFERTGNKGKAAADFAAAIAIDSKVIDAPGAVPDSMADALDDRCCYEIWAGTLDKAMADCRRCLKLRPHDSRASYYVGTVLLLQGKFDDARAAYEIALPSHCPLGFSATEGDLIDLRDTGHGPPETTAFLGWLYIKAGKPKLGITELQKYLTDHADGPLAAAAKELVARHPAK